MILPMPTRRSWTASSQPQYGEHEARYWLDAARYAETVVLHFDEPC